MAINVPVLPTPALQKKKLFILYSQHKLQYNIFSKDFNGDWQFFQKSPDLEPVNGSYKPMIHDHNHSYMWRAFG